MKKLHLLILLFFTLGVQSQEKYVAETLWTDVVTSQPEGFVVSEDGNVSITSGEGLAWFISVVNGLNGQDANDFKDVTVTLENDVNIDGNNWIAVGTAENPFRGVFDGKDFYIHGIKMYDVWEGRNFGLFGYLDNAVVRNVKLGKGEIVGYEECGGIAYMADNNTLIDRCVVKTEMSFANYSGGIVGINKDSKISNCALISERLEGSMVCVGGIAGQNISANADAIIENCFVSTEYGSSYSTEYAGGIVGKNMSENENFMATIRNCYAAPLKMYGHSGGVAAYNSENSLIENSYYTIEYGSQDYTLYEENDGVVMNSSLFDEDLQLEENVEVNGENVSELLEALNKWVENSQSEQYVSWMVMEDVNYGYPILATMGGDFDTYVYQSFFANDSTSINSHTVIIDSNHNITFTICNKDTITINDNLYYFVEPRNVEYEYGYKTFWYSEEIIYFREEQENGRLFMYIKNNDLEEEILLCDMSLNVGDTFTLYYYPYEIEVENVRYEDGRKIIELGHFYGGELSIDNLMFIEGVFPMVLPDFYTETFSELICQHKDNELVYIVSSDIEDCILPTYLSVDKIDDKGEGITINPTVLSYGNNISVESVSEIKGVKMIDMLGREIKISVNQINYSSCQISLSQKCSSGIYMVIVETSNDTCYEKVIIK